MFALLRGCWCAAKLYCMDDVWVMCYALIPPAHGTDDAHGCAAVRRHLVNAREGGNALQRMRLILTASGLTCVCLHAQTPQHLGQ